MSKIKNNKRKKKYQKNKKQNKSLKNVVLVITTVVVPILSLFFTVSSGYYEKSKDTFFSFRYVTVRIDDSNWINNYIKNGNFVGFLDMPTYNNEVNSILYTKSEDLIGLYVTYLIIEQTGNSEALDVKINFNIYNKCSANREKKEIYDLTNSNYQSFSKKIEYPFKDGEKLKIPLSICKNEEYDLGNCYCVFYKPTSIKYKNRYLFSKKYQEIRYYSEHEVIVDGKNIMGVGSE